MPLFEYPELVFTQIALLVISGIWLLRRNDEIPLLISSFLFYVASYRYWAVTNGIGHWVNLGSFGFSSITDEVALIALSYIVLGQIFLISTYMVRQRKVLPVVIPIGDRSFLQWLSPKVILLGLFCLPLVIVVRTNLLAQLLAGKSLGFQVSSYLILFPLALVGIALLVFSLWKQGGFTSFPTKIAAISIILGVAYFTYGPQTRFLFLGWLIGGGIILSASYRPQTRLVILTCCAVLGISLFAVAGAMRNIELTAASLNQAAWERAFSAEDANMLDGFVLIQEIYPQRLDFSLGMEHLEIIMRPIPRAWWPNKPVGGYMNKLGLITANTGFTLGISPTIFGSFYAEYGLIGIVFFSIVYGTILADLVSYTTKLHPFANSLIRAMVCAALIPLLRGGDLPGIYAWFGMAFWPCLLLLWIKRSYLKQQLVKPIIVYYNAEKHE